MIFRRFSPDLEIRTALAGYRQSPDAILLLKEGAFVECNPGAEAIYGRTRAEIIGQNPVVFSRATQADGRPTAEHVGERVQQAVRDGFARFEWFNMRGTEEVRMLVTVIPVPQEGPDAVLVMCQDMAATGTVVDTLKHGLAALAGGDLNVRIDTRFSEEFEPLRDSFNTAADRMAESMAEVTSVAAALHNGCSDIRQASDDLSGRTERQAASLEESAAAIQEITQNVREAATLVDTTEAIIADTHRDAQSSAGIVEDTTRAMAGIESASKEIGEIISVIDGIAFQTNLLALNAGVEAARAGDAGKGFAVVASEVRALAQRSADAAKDVKARVTASTAQVDRGVELVSSTGIALKRITEQMDRIRALIGNIATASHQQAETLGQINIAVGEMDSITQHNAAMVEQTTAAARNLAEEAARLNDAVSTFRVGHGDARGAHVAPLRMVAGGRR
ncbi:chemotaxis protein [Sphingomonas sp. Leaf23]|uniref:methyl-accepting chemotaxis protein n=1 Tax=Sphingomonas sp. Leaf23 TaxID=1735689 RepID=UPI0006F57436|nr:methyl-accepting chemotaxis protein [Sphingomonas sp. Leaf23]KQM86000.1 chemotaxis protein [Sphingomonas sp. Leaf23]